MKKMLVAIGIIFCMASPSMAGDVKISGAVELQYLKSSDHYGSKGDDDFKANELYVKVSKEVANNVEAMIKIDGADLESKTGSSSTHKAIEEAQIIFKNVANQPLTLILGKDEMPFGQDYEKFLLDSRTHGFEIDKVLGAHGIYKAEGFGSIALGFFERAPKESGGSSTDRDTALTDSFAVKVKADKFVENLSVEASYAKTGKDELVATEVDEDRMSVGAKLKVADATIHAEYTSFSDFENVEKSDLDVIQVGADYKIGNVLLKVRHEMSDDDVDNNNDEENRTAAGISYYFSKKALVAVEWEKVSYDGAADDEDELLLGASFKF
ncbi:MAG: porin [Proteobacteria bacterium]|nr:porin [Pseudomonadota bacterium]